MIRAARATHALKALPAPVRWLAAPVALLGCVILLVGTWGAPAAPVTPTPRAKEVPYCEALARALPQRLTGHGREHSDSPYVVIWSSSPRTVLRCGVPRPDALNGPQALKSAPEVNGVQWFDEPDGEGGYRFTTTLREANVEVSVPAGAYPSYADPLPTLSDAVKASVPVWNEPLPGAASTSPAP
ncbi:DUF3515 domain-containing protein [Kitasatospora sp. NBC_00240]|uniref:DUF3515 domain-containing protein n=1 Tax=Kitasatospora sp. NBC_00240 TaxID=2903567 RepID=UPI00224D69C5|nr:DUF3515 domain-containing protein [Kitasatospora sp. NBC_00240]MCX5210648.1 DUF3515 domain-containing protein [Kitasatospora sp. NBC_00240]